MTIYERLESMNSIELRLEDACDKYQTAEAQLVELVGEYVVGAEVNCQLYGPGHVIAYSGTTLDNIIVDIEFATTTKKFSLPHIMNTGKFVTFVDTLEIGIIWNKVLPVHTELTEQFRAIDKLAKQIEADARKKAEEDRKLEEKYQKSKAKAIADFESLTQTTRPISTADEFYYSLGWLTKHTGTVSAALPDYLLGYFEKYFGNEANPRVVDSRKRTVNGYPMQWALSMKASLPGKVEGKVPAFLTTYLSSTGNAIADTAFIWDLIENYGFQFGKKQDVEKIRACVPVQHLSYFEAGLA